jgi:biopolymer transport protein ExbD
MAIRYAQRPDAEDTLIAEINTTPLVDVMLVLLDHLPDHRAGGEQLHRRQPPLETNQQKDPNRENVIITVDAQGGIYWFETKLPDASGLPELLGKIAAMQPQPELHIRGDARADYAPIGQVVEAAQRAGIARIGFLTEPPGR